MLFQKIGSFISSNSVVLTTVFSFVDTVATILLTCILILQNKKLSRDQLESEKNLNEKMLKMQEKAAKIEALPYKRELYKNTFAILELCENIEKYWDTLDIKQKSPKQIRGLLDILQNNYISDTNGILWSLREAEYIFPDNLSKAILDIRYHFDKLLCHISFIDSETIKMIAINDDEICEMNILHIDGAIEESAAILAYAAFVEENIPKELVISA